MPGRRLGGCYEAGVTRLLLAYDDSPSARRAAQFLDGYAAQEALVTVERFTAGSGAVADAILAKAAESGADAVVMGTRGAGPLGGYALGSVALRVGQSGAVPVLLVKEDSRLPAAPGRSLKALLATDGSEPSVRAARLMAAWKPWLGALEVQIAHVQEPLTVLEAVLPPHDDVAKQWSTAPGEAASEEARALFEREKIPFHLHLSAGDPALEVAQLAAQTGSELLVLGTRGRGVARHALFGSVAMKAAAASAVPVLLVP